MRQLRPVVDEADRRATQSHEEGRERGQRVLREEEERDRHGEHDQKAAHGRRALLHDVALRALFSNVLAELVSPQKVDELRARPDGDDHCDDPGEEDFRHGSGGNARESLGNDFEPNRPRSLD